jgi:hypothetical protein
MEEIIKKKWYCGVGFGFLNKGEKIGKEYSVIMRFLKECKEGKYSFLNSERVKLAGESFDGVNNAKDFY